MPHDQLEPYRPSWSLNPGNYEACMEGTPQYDNVSWITAYVLPCYVYFPNLMSNLFREIFQYLLGFIYAFCVTHSTISNLKIISWKFSILGVIYLSFLCKPFHYIKLKIICILPAVLWILFGALSIYRDSLKTLIIDEILWILFGALSIYRWNHTVCMQCVCGI